MHIHTRRQFVRYGAGTLAGAALLAGGWWQWQARDGAGYRPSGLGTAADELLASLDGAGALGEWVLAEHPDYDLPIADLAQRLRERLSLPVDGPVETQLLSSRLQQRIQQDFADEDLLAVQQWQVSTTEALAAVLRFRVAGISSAVQIAASGPIEQQIVVISNWGPRNTTAGVPPNSFGEGFSALWFDAANAPRWAQIAIDGKRLPTEYRDNRVLVASFQGHPEFQKRLFGTPGEYLITLHDDMHNTWQAIDVFVVGPALAEQPAQADSAASGEPATESGFCPVKDWGPRQTTAGIANNPQPDGTMGVWIDIECAPADTRVLAGDQSLKAHITERVITFTVPPGLFQQAGELPLTLVSESTGEQLQIGILNIKPNSP